MNLAQLERMVQEGDMSSDALRYLLSCRGECEWLDYKEDLPLEIDKSLCDFGKDVLAMKNVGGGYLVVGVRDKTWEPVGLSHYVPYDEKQLRDKVRKSTGLDLEVDIVHHEVTVSTETHLFALVLVRASRHRRKRRSPSLVSRDCCAKQSYGLRRGEIYYRRGDSSVRLASAEELEDLLDSLEARADEDAARATEEPSPFAVQDGLYWLLEPGYARFVGRDAIKEKVVAAVLRDPRIWIINVHGPGGVGKSALVNWATYEFYRSREFEAILHLTGKESVLTDKGIRPFGRTLYSLENLLDHIFSLFEEQAPVELDARKGLALEVLACWKTLLVLDNMETVSDGRILDFVRTLPVGSTTKVLMTSRQTSGGWELPIPVSELDANEVRQFTSVKAAELNVAFPQDDETMARLTEVSGGLPLAIQWIIGQFRVTEDLAGVLSAVASPDSPVLEFSFRNMWSVLSPDAQHLLAALTIFESPPNTGQLAVATGYSVERIERALEELGRVTLVTKVTQQADGHVVFTSLPITLAFVRHQLGALGDFEVQSRRRLHQFEAQMALQESELSRFRSDFERYGIQEDNERRAAILCRRGESEMFAGNPDVADTLFKQAKDLAPQSSYVLAMIASYELLRGRIGLARERIDEACRRCSRRTGALCYTIKAQILEKERNRIGRVEALRKALEYEPENLRIRHQLGVALSIAGNAEAAVIEFTGIVEVARDVPALVETLVTALTTRIINLRRLNRNEAADRDAEWVRGILSCSPQLQYAARKFQEVEEDSAVDTHRRTIAG